MFKKYFTELSKEVQEQWVQLSKPGGAPGKQARKYELINAHVPRSAGYKTGRIVVNSRILRKIVQLSETNKQETTEVP